MRSMYINGEFTKGSATGEIEVTNPVTEASKAWMNCVRPGMLAGISIWKIGRIGIRMEGDR